MKSLIYNITDFRRGMDGNIYKDGAVARIEHFDSSSGQLRPKKEIIASTSALGAITALALEAYAKVSNSVYSLGYDYSAATVPAIYDSTYATKYAFSGAGTVASVMTSYLGKLYGLWKGTHLWEMQTNGSFNAAKGAISYTSCICPPKVHSKDNIMYVATDNVISTLNSSGTFAGSVLTLPTGFLIYDLDEWNDYLLIVGNDSTKGKTIAYLWDRDSSLATLTQSYDLGSDTLVASAVLGGVPFFVLARSYAGTNPEMVISYIAGNRLVEKSKFEFEPTSSTGGFLVSDTAKTKDNDALYFYARSTPRGDATFHRVVYRLDAQGNLTMAFNINITGTGDTGIVISNYSDIRIAGGSTGSWQSTTTYGTISAFETGRIRSDKLSENVDFQGCTVTCEALPSGAQILISARKNNETAWTTIGTFTTQNALKFSVAGLVAKNALSGLDRAKEVQLRVESTGGAVITGFQALFNTVSDENYG